MSGLDRHRSWEAELGTCSCLMTTWICARGLCSGRNASEKLTWMTKGMSAVAAGQESLRSSHTI